MKYFKTINDGYLVAVGTGTGETEITESEYNELLSIIHSRPTPQSGYDYKLKADILEWELVELPEVDPVEEDATIEDYESALSDLGVDVS